MFQSIPNAEYYAEFGRELLRSGKKTSLTAEELQDLQISTRHMAGDKTYTGHILDQAEADSLNQYVDELNRTSCKIKREFLMDKKHQLFVIFSQEISASEIRKAESNKTAA